MCNFFTERDRLAPMQGEGMAIMIGDELLRRRDSELIEEDVGKENADLPNWNYGLSILRWPVGGLDRVGWWVEG